MSQATLEPGDQSFLQAVPFAPPLDSHVYEDLDDREYEGLSLERLLTSLDGPRPARGDGQPAWLRDLTDCVADLFEPLSRTGRVGFETRPASGRWELEVFLSLAEHIGGPLDGHVEPINFRFDVASLFRCFEKVTDCTWSVFPEPDAVTDGLHDRSDIPAGLSSLAIEGLVSDGGGATETVTVRVYSLPPEEAGVGLKLYSGGETVAT